MRSTRVECDCLCSEEKFERIKSTRVESGFCTRYGTAVMSSATGIFICVSPRGQWLEKAYVECSE